VRNVGFMNEDEIQEAVARGVEEGVVNVAASAATGYLAAGCLVLLAKAAFYTFIAVLFLGYLACHR
jgi:hypothetical protein